MKARRTHRSRVTARRLTAFALMALPVWHQPVHVAAGETISGKVTASDATSRAETVVYLKTAPGSTARKGAVDQKGMKFIPHVLVITVGDTIEFQNHDGVNHNVFSTDNGGFNLGTFKPNETRSHAFTSANVSYSVLCSVHPEMHGYIFVGQNPYHAVVGADGSYSINNVPPGAYDVAVWNPTLKAASQHVTVVAGRATSASFSLTK